MSTINDAIEAQMVTSFHDFEEQMRKVYARDTLKTRMLAVRQFCDFVLNGNSPRSFDAQWPPS